MTNDCILLKKGTCNCMTKKHPNCGSKECPFFKTIQAEKKSQMYAKQRCKIIGSQFITMYPL